MSLENTYKLNDGVEIPIIGFGTWQMPNSEHTSKILENAINVGYRHIDTATMYGNEKSVGYGIKRSGIPREKLFVTTKLNNPDHTYKRSKDAINHSLQLLNMDYIDLYLIHWPNPRKYRDNWQAANAESWRAMEEAQKEGKIRSLGVSNFMSHHLKALIETATIMPTVNQLQLNPSDMQPEAVEASKTHNLLLEAYSPLGTGEIFNIKELIEIADNYGKSVAQVAIRWSLQHGFLPLPKTATLERAAENGDVFDFELSVEDMRLIDSLEGRAGKMFDPDKISF